MGAWKNATVIWYKKLLISSDKKRGERWREKARNEEGRGCKQSLEEEKNEKKLVRWRVKKKRIKDEEKKK